MFSKMKSRKAPLSLSSVSNVIKTSGTKDLSPSHFNAKDIEMNFVTQLGLPKDSIVAVAYDPVQSLLAVSTTYNEVRVYGQNSVEVVFEFNATHPITKLKFVKGVYLVAITESSGGITVLSLHSKSILVATLAPGAITAVEADPSLDFIILGLTNGSLMFFDVDRLNMSPLRVDNLQKKVLPKQKMSPVLHLEWHPRDIGTVLVTYSHCAILYSIASGELKSKFVYVVEKGAKSFELSSFVANGGKKKMFGSSKDVIPELTESHFHPNGLHVLTLHRDNTIAFWDAASGALIQTRNIFEVGLHKPGPSLEIPEVFHPIQSVRWICGEDPELTQLVICGAGAEGNLLHVLDFGYTLKYSMTSNEKQAEFYALPQSGQRILPVLFNLRKQDEQEYITSILPISGDNEPYFNGNHNPSYLLLVSNLNALYIIQFSTVGGAQGSTDLGGLLLPPSIAFIHPPVTSSSVQFVKRKDWFSMMSTRVSGGAAAKSNLLLKGGAPVENSSIPKSFGYNDTYRNILVTGHESGLVRLLDITKTEFLEAESIVQISLKETLYNSGNPNSVKIVDVSCAFGSKEMLVALGSGDVVICKFGRSNGSQGNHSTKDYARCPVQHENGNGKILDIRERILGSVTQTSTFLPVSLLQLDKKEKVSCIKMSDIGFAAVAYTSGRLVVCDITRGPAIILNLESISEHLVTVTGECYATVVEFSIMEYGQDGYSSVLLHVGTNCGGNLLNFKIVPMGNGGFEVVFTDRTIGLNYKSGAADPLLLKLDQIIPINAVDGSSAVAEMEIFNKLGQGVVIPGYVVTTSERDLRVLKIPKTKLSHKVVEDSCLRSGVLNFHNNGVMVASLVKTGYVKLFSLPSLADIADIKVPKEIYVKIKRSLESGIASQSEILSTGDFFVRSSKSEFLHMSAFDKGSRLHRSHNKENVTDLLFNENAIIPPRPTAGTLLWATGQTGYMSVEDLALLVAGPNRKPAKHPESQLAHNISPEANLSQGYGGYGAASQQSSRGYKEPVRRSTTASSGGVAGQGWVRSLQAGLESVEETIGGYANSASEAMTESVEGQKRAMYSAAFKDKFGF